MIGDNRDESADSRDPTSGVGLVPEDHILGTGGVIFFSLDRENGGHDGSLLSVVRWSRIGVVF